MNYREVKASDRLPGKSGSYFVKYSSKHYGYGNVDFIKHDNEKQKEWEEDTFKMDVDWWLEPIPEISEEEIIDKLTDHLSAPTGYGSVEVCGINEAAKAIIKLLNPEK